LQNVLQIPFQTAVTGGDAQVTVQRDGKLETIAVKIPPGIEEGQKIRLRGQGERAGPDAPPGDILIHVRVAPHPHFERRGKNLHVRVPVTLAEAVVGSKIDVPTPRGTIALSVPPGTSSGKKLRVKGHGVAGKDAPPGDLIAEIQIMLPPDLDADDWITIKKIDREHPLNPRSELRW
jgi:DnaJ-class molecular chaperone